MAGSPIAPAWSPRRREAWTCDRFRRARWSARRVLQDGVGNQPDTFGRDIGGAFPDQRDTGVQALSELARDLDFAEAGRVRVGSRHRKEDCQHDATDGEDRAGPLSRATEDSGVDTFFVAIERGRR